MTQKLCNKLAWLSLDSEQSIQTGFLGKILSWCRLLTGSHFEYEIQFHNIRIEITLIVTMQPANRKQNQNKNLVLSNELIKVELPPWKI